MLKHGRLELKNKEVCSIREKQYYIDNKEATKAKSARYRLKNKEAIALNDKQYYIDNRELIATRARERRIQHKEHIESYNQKTIECVPCGINIIICSKARHCKSKMHQNNLVRTEIIDNDIK